VREREREREREYVEDWFEEGDTESVIELPSGQG
jgi:hypothetical protein